MAAVDITCPHCNRNQKVAEHRLKETVYCLLCQQLISDVYMYKVAPKQQELTIKLKGRIVSEFGTTKLEDLKSKSDEYTGRFEPVDDDDSGEVEGVDDTTRIFDTGSYAPIIKRKKLSTAARTYLIGGGVVAVLAVGVTILGISLLSDGPTKTESIETVGKEGDRLDRYPNGAKKAEWRVVNVGGVDLIEGAWHEWFENGADKTIGSYTQGEKDGPWRGWHSNGQLAYEGKYDNGKLVGPWKEWHANARKAAEGAYIAGGKDGEWRTWYASGIYASYEKYENGLPVGDWVSWYEDGTVKSQGSYAAGLREGRWNSFHDNGAEELVENWKGGVLDGQSRGGYRNRQKSFEGLWQDGKRMELWSWWYSNNRLQKQGEYADGLETGRWQEWYPTSVLKSEGRYVAGRRVGTWNEYDEDGNPSCKREYEDGAETSQQWLFRGDVVDRQLETFPDGATKHEWTTIKGADGTPVRHGYERTYYSSGTLAESGAWQKGQREGPWRTYDQTGALVTETTWHNGVKAE